MSASLQPLTLEEFLVWDRSPLIGIDATLDLQEIGVAVPLAFIYDAT